MFSNCTSCRKLYQKMNNEIVKDSRVSIFLWLTEIPNQLRDFLPIVWGIHIFSNIKKYYRSSKRIIKNIFLWFSEYYFDYDDDDIECNLPLLDSADISATSFLNERGPKNARLNGKYYINLSCVLYRESAHKLCNFNIFFFKSTVCFGNPLLLDIGHKP
jgi:hypothetical protein